ncbi:uncharacterized protein LOC106663551 [Cimex lectularius]|uniref:Odorant binding protein n=1 Tax=Cimex lectularius TaxID=79782 RepID=A0A8I6TEG9_CIMLE|nr:uncharacterized protein LOC106663551 [Cimex lectularius]
MRLGVSIGCIVTIILQCLPIYCEDKIDDHPDYYNSPYFSDHLHYAFDLCSKDYSEKFDPSFVLFLKNELFLNTHSDEICVVGCTLRTLGVFKKGNLLDLKQLSQWLRSNLRKDLPKRDDFIGYYITLASWCFPDAQGKDDCAIGKYYYNCVTKLMPTMKLPYDQWSRWDHNPFDVL